MHDLEPLRDARHDLPLLTDAPQENPLVKLSLKRELLAELSAAELLGVVGAAAAVPTTPVEECTQNSNVVCLSRGIACTSRCGR